MIRARSLARRYAVALGDLAQEQGLVDRVERELQQVLKSLEQDEGVRRVWEHQRVAPSEKWEMVNKAFSGSLHQLTLNFLGLVIAKRREAYLPEMVAEFIRYADELRGLLEVEVRSARHLPPDEAAELEQSLSRSLGGRPVRLVMQVQPDLIGGLAIRIGDRVIDGSLAGRLRRLEKLLRETPLGRAG